MNSNDHYEEYGFTANLTFEASILIDLGSSGSEAYELKITFETDVFAFNIRQLVLWTRPLGEYLTNGVESQDTYIGAAYDLEIGDIYLKYCETASVGATNLWEGIDGTTTYWAQSAATLGQYKTCWKDPIYNFDLVNYLPSSVSSYLGQVKIYQYKLY